MFGRAVQFVWRITYARYVLASGMALLVDMATFLWLLHVGMPSVTAAAAGYSIGLLAHWLVSSRLVFNRQAPVFLSQRRRQKILFVASALIGLAVTGMVVGAGAYAGLDPRLAKLVAIVISFQITYVLRRAVVFA